ncbi:diacylglycerol kinase family protein [Halobacillus salinus]|uniref:Diacylglycerol kinase family protein n=1 Tax=Halobacillus salinus TaxID=192814 RepID=A0A4Z0H2U9_9BACI|nr:diacylglycerol kinase family protein [Halobacillus salinus]TGB04269.1 diacylglycerol kinase family protein [Halobacillus salinus]
MSLGSKDQSKKKRIGFRHAWNGIKEVTRSERNFKLHLFSTVLVIISSAILGLQAIEWSVIILTCSIVLALEMVNSSIERILDYLAPEWNPLAGKIKDIAAGAVLVASIGAFVIACILLLPKLLILIGVE